MSSYISHLDGVGYMNRVHNFHNSIDKIPSILSSYKDESINVVEGKSNFRNRLEVTFSDNIAVVEAVGDIVAGRMNSFLASFLEFLPLGNLLDTLEDLVRDPEVSAIVIRFHSPGGTVTQTSDAFYRIRELSYEKGIYAYAGDKMTSAAYRLGCACTNVYTSVDGILGSIGVIYAALNDERALKNTGIEQVIITNDGADYKYLNNMEEAGRNKIKERLNALSRGFVNDVASGRNVTEAEVREKWGDCCLYVGQDAVDIGLADGVTTLYEYIDIIKKKELEKDLNN